MTRRHLLLALLLATPLATDCGGPAIDPVARLLDDIAVAATQHDAEAIVAALADGFSGQGGLGRSEVAAELRRYFGLYENVEVGLADVVIERSGGRATARFRAVFAGKPKAISGPAGLLPDAERFSFETSVVEEGGAWRIAAATWERLGPRP